MVLVYDYLVDLLIINAMSCQYYWGEISRFVLLFIFSKAVFKFFLKNIGLNQNALL